MAGLVQAGQQILKRGHHGLDPLRQGGDVAVQGVDTVQVHAAQKRMVGAEPADHGLLQVGNLRAHPASGQVGEDFHVAFAADECVWSA